MWIFQFIFWFCLGLALVVYREKVQRFTGTFEFAEKWFGMGGTFVMILLVGLVMMVGSVLWVLGVLDLVVGNTIGRLFFLRG